MQPTTKVIDLQSIYPYLNFSRMITLALALDANSSIADLSLIKIYQLPPATVLTSRFQLFKFSIFVEIS
ncbi:hypothetical protein MJO28_001741 [Puccinia striiformis f. sp. tritici]|uniref:Uncharacterized protein n=1 Tax=Puccinia striiformis f. sp. tritici TaxID=168172 RepID=A0ACC0EUU0_9BASI|nr:hypothetical protein MJO28_001741 [Puccinia striiformis f. sp. tritici]